MARSGLRRAPSSYNTFSYNAVQLVLFVSATIVAGITFFFIWHLTHDGWPLPWTFIVTAAISFLTACAILLRTLVHFCHTINPTHQFAVSSAVLIGWLLSFALLSWNARVTLTTACDASRWGAEGRGGRLVCRVYKAQYAFAVFGILSAIATFALDYNASRRLTRHGAYGRMENQHDQGWNGKGQQSHDDPWAVDQATELDGYGKAESALGRSGKYQALEDSRRDNRGQYVDMDGDTASGAGYGHDTEYRGRGNLR